jgi:hypothetical protein
MICSVRYREYMEGQGVAIPAYLEHVVPPAVLEQEDAAEDSQEAAEDEEEAEGPAGLFHASFHS